MGAWVGVLPMRGGGVVLTMSGVVGVVTRVGGAVFFDGEKWGRGCVGVGALTTRGWVVI